ncbi:hypothetical protein [Amaricoccus solimangrovi]|uniref:Uncharacterized protein n=1 Tax=Amaricoccus solimangrovi TaxID=2589815 RepID=A0A501WGB3_9RHOB|nr:hypothetical protein [Amaricoccus solimangrovi]TPE47380.1 hypothetical protein FJM51_20120 [Amaricoccus solimangrovi]
MLRFDFAAASACALVMLAAPALAGGSGPRGGHLLGPDVAAAMIPIAGARPARGGHLLGPDVAAAQVPIATPALGAGPTADCPAGGTGCAELVSGE